MWFDLETKIEPELQYCIFRTDCKLLCPRLNQIVYWFGSILFILVPSWSRGIIKFDFLFLLVTEEHRRIVQLRLISNLLLSIVWITSGLLIMFQIVARILATSFPVALHWLALLRREVVQEFLVYPVDLVQRVSPELSDQLVILEPYPILLRKYWADWRRWLWIFNALPNKRCHCARAGTRQCGVRVCSVSRCDDRSLWHDLRISTTPSCRWVSLKKARFIAAGRDLDTTLSPPFWLCILFAIVEQLVKLKFLVQQCELEWLILNKWRRLIHTSRVKFPLVNMSASCCLVSM